MLLVQILEDAHSFRTALAPPKSRPGPGTRRAGPDRSPPDLPERVFRPRRTSFLLLAENKRGAFDHLTTWALEPHAGWRCGYNSHVVPQTQVVELAYPCWPAL